MGSAVALLYSGKESPMRNVKGALWFFGVMGLMYCTAVLAWFLPPSPGVRLGLLAWQQLLFILGGIFGGGRDHLKPVPLKAAARGLAWGVGLYFLSLLVGALVFATAAHFLGADTARELLARDRTGVEMLMTSRKPLLAAGTVLLLLVGAPLGEELFFRGLLVNLLKERLGDGKAVLLAALLFAALHFYTLQFLPVFLSGAALGLLLIRSGSIFVPMAAHFAVNALALGALLSSL